MHTLERVRIVTRSSTRVEDERGSTSHEPRAMCNHSINYVTARSCLFLLRIPRAPKCATRWLGKLANPVCTTAVASSSFPPLSSAPYPYRSVPFHQDSVTHLSPFGCPETERKHRRDSAGIDGEHIREDVAPLSELLLDG